MDKLFEKLMKVNEQSEENLFSVDVSLYIRHPSDDVVYNSRVNIKYYIDIEFKPWGIGSYNIRVQDVDIAFSKEDGEDKVITVVGDNVVLNWEEGNALIPKKLFVELNNDYSVMETELEIAYIAG